MGRSCRLVIDELRRAAADWQSALAAGNRFALLGCEDGHSRLGWARPPAPWAQVERALDRALQSRALRNKSRWIFCGTGGWIHSVGIVAETLDSFPPAVDTIYSLDPAALGSEENRHLERTACIGISASGNTIETRLLMSSLRERFTSAGLQPADHLQWLSSQGNDSLPLTPDTLNDTGALFSGPLTMAFLLPMTLVGGFNGARRCYESFVDASEQTAEEAVRQALDPGAGQRFLHLHTGARGDALDRWVLQLARQSLCGKSARFNPKILVGGEQVHEGFERVNLTAHAAVEPLVARMLTACAAQYFTAAAAWRQNIAFATHDNVQRYKRLIGDVPSKDLPEPNLGALEQRVGTIGRTTGKRFLEVVIYAAVQSEILRILSRRYSSLTGCHCEVFEGSDWNHHSYQAAAESDGTVYVLAGPWRRDADKAGISQATLSRNLQFLNAIAEATAESLQTSGRLTRPLHS